MTVCGASTTITEQVLTVAQSRGGQLAMAGVRDDGSYTWTGLAARIQAAAAGLARRGVRARDAVGVYVCDAVSYVLASHAIRAAGGVPSPVGADLDEPRITGQLTGCDARLLITAPALAATALAAANQSRVRQVICFGKAAGWPGTIPFHALLESGTLRPVAASGPDLALLPFTRQPDGSLRPAGLTQAQYAAELSRTAASAPLTRQDVVAAAPPAGDGLAYTLLLDNALIVGALVIAARTSDLTTGALAAGAGQRPVTAVIAPAGLVISAPGRIRVFTVPGRAWPGDPPIS